MQLTIHFPDVLPSEKFAWYVQQIENLLRSDHISVEIHQESVSKSDPWDELDLEDIAVHTGIPDFAEQHDHYLYGTPKRI
ncbi:hypothetical protein U27_01717 [Candidatus Vecturithrix granuli]|uniref:Uncharacterized protein n=1 Tax=Vecturithrix granuli TaxID=1499967 RepID=A0A0S6WAF0_VECG1|nr:hypothetical protein U27_01717 [Candidatus Vecturithrix granuli]